MSYQDFPTASMLLSPRLTTQGDPSSSLAGINTAGLADGAECYVVETKTRYQLDLQSTEAPSGDDVIEPGSGPGRWKPAGGGAGGAVLQVQTTEIVPGQTTSLTSTTFVPLPSALLPPLVMSVTPGSKVIVDAIASFASSVAPAGQELLMRVTKQEPSDGSPVQVGTAARANAIGQNDEQQLSLMGSFTPSEDTVQITLEALTENGASGITFETSKGPIFIEATEVSQ